MCGGGGGGGGQRMARMAEPEAEGRLQVASCHPAARLLLPGVHAATGTAYIPRRPFRNGHGRKGARYGGWAMSRHGMGQSCTHCAEHEGGAVPYLGGGCRAGMSVCTIEVTPCWNISPGWPCPWAQ